jgi:cytochrome b561
MKVTNNLNEKYSKGIITIHWLSTLLILALFPLGKYMSGIEASEKMTLIQTHSILGIVVLILTLFRSWLYFKKKRPSHLQTESAFNDKLIVWVHNLFYVLLLAITISGIATLIIGGYVNAFEIQNPELIKNENDISSMKAHGILSLIMMVLLVVHVVGVVKHYIATKENTLQRILPRR